MNWEVLTRWGTLISFQYNSYLLISKQKPVKTIQYAVKIILEIEDLNKQWKIWYQGKLTSREQQPQDILLSDRPNKPNDKSSS